MIDSHEHLLIESHDVIVDYAAHPTTVTVKDGDWFDPSVWSAGVPTAESVFSVEHVVSLDAKTSPSGDLNGDSQINKDDYLHWKKGDRSLDDLERFCDDFFGVEHQVDGGAIALDGRITATGRLICSTALFVRTLHVHGYFGLLSQYSELIIRDLPFDTARDPQFTGHGLLVHGTGTFVMRGEGWDKDRRATVRSESPAGTRGHIMAMGRCWLDLQTFLLADLGRTTIDQLDSTHVTKDRVVRHLGTNQIGRYTLHIHHVYGPENHEGPQFIVADGIFRNGRKWAIAVHDSHYGLIADNDIDGFDGAGIYFEEGNELGNVLENNEIRNIRGSGEGVQGRGEGRDPVLKGTGTASDPYRTVGDIGHEGVGIGGRGISNHIRNNRVYNCPIGVVKWSRFKPGDVVRIPAFKGASTHDGQVKVVAAGQQLEHDFIGNAFDGCEVAANFQGLTGVVALKGLKVANCPSGFDFSYNDVIRIEGCTLEGTGESWPMQPGFTKRFEWINCKVTGWRGSVQIWNDGFVKGGEYDAVSVVYKHVASGQRAIIIDGATIGHLANIVDDLNKNRDYTAVNDLLIYNFQGVAGDDFQLFFAEQADDYIPKNLTDGNPRRVTPEEGLTNKQIEVEYGCRFGGKGIPKGATKRDGVTGWCAPIPADLAPPKIIGRTVIPIDGGLIVRCKTDKPARIRTEDSLGDIPLGRWVPMVLPAPDFKTDHEVTITGLKPRTKYSLRQPAVDEIGNLGGDVRSSGINYQVITAVTK